METFKPLDNQSVAIMIFHQCVNFIAFFLNRLIEISPEIKYNGTIITVIDTAVTSILIFLVTNFISS
jgi:hypothetical protein